jgi:hypothetical protein
VFHSLCMGFRIFLRNKLQFILEKFNFHLKWVLAPSFGLKNTCIEDYRNILLNQQFKKWKVDPLYPKNLLFFFYVFCMHITVILAFKVILNKDLYNITIHIKETIDKLINIDYFETENGHFSQTGDNFDVCLHKCPSVGI